VACCTPVPSRGASTSRYSSNRLHVARTTAPVITSHAATAEPPIEWAPAESRSRASRSSSWWLAVRERRATVPPISSFTGERGRIGSCDSCRPFRGPPPDRRPHGPFTARGGPARGHDGKSPGNDTGVVHAPGGPLAPGVPRRARGREHAGLVPAPGPRVGDHAPAGAPARRGRGHLLLGH